ncbi:hypothetical protein L2E82_20611 [Cichorium intybus]|uniref:Uncharacterized protein n=1 Tax=Cichorium intybus TaxID=13427 RepID=A0ACB9DTV8_CICIN|nr:hypothetical protein L2E82_20611 [Cichorium intybus]
MGKKAVLIGCNYAGTKAELKGCINDIKNDIKESQGIRIHRKSLVEEEETKAAYEDDDDVKSKSLPLST